MLLPVARREVLVSLGRLISVNSTAHVSANLGLCGLVAFCPLKSCACFPCTVSRLYNYLHNLYTLRERWFHALIVTRRSASWQLNLVCEAHRGSLLSLHLSVCANDNQRLIHRRSRMVEPVCCQRDVISSDACARLKVPVLRVPANGLAGGPPCVLALHTGQHDYAYLHRIKICGFGSPNYLFL